MTIKTKNNQLCIAPNFTTTSSCKCCTRARRTYNKSAVA